ncbi:MAG: 2-oxo acid dehydrogenase subunit E2 [Rhizobiaceae bacterium]
MKDVIASPSVRRLAAERGIDLATLATRLRRTTIAREDVLGETESGMPANTIYWDVDHSQWGPVREEPLNRVAEVAAANLVAAQQCIPAVTHHDSADMTRIETTRTRLKSQRVRITALAFHFAVLARCLKEYPRFNASLSQDGKKLILKEYVHIGMAVDTPQGLVVPVIRDVNLKRVPEISAEIAELAERARARRIRPEELGGASMTISSLGGIGGESFSPVVNPPEVAILGISAMEVRPVWDGQDFNPVPKVPLDLSYDHRVINGADAARFMKTYCELIKDPDKLLIG